MVVALITVTVYGGPVFLVVACCVALAVLKPVTLFRLSVILGSADALQSQAYRSCARQMQRLQTIVPGPILSIYGETIAGTAVIRAFGAQSMVFDGTLAAIW